MQRHRGQPLPLEKKVQIVGELLQCRNAHVSRNSGDGVALGLRRWTERMRRRSTNWQSRLLIRSTTSGTRPTMRRSIGDDDESSASESCKDRWRRCRRQQQQFYQSATSSTIRRWCIRMSYQKSCCVICVGQRSSSSFCAQIYFLSVSMCCCAHFSDV
jgi:hypothetical protein